MVQFFYETVQKLKSKNKKYWPYVYKIHKLLLNILYPIYVRFQKENGLDKHSRIIVSLTSYPARIDTVWLTVSTLLNQTMKPYKVILWLAKDQFPEKKLPKKLQDLQKRGLEIAWCEDLKPHKKYYYTMQKYSEYFVVTADDDIFYPENHLEKLWKGYEKYPGNIICHWSHKIIFDKEKEFAPYNDWENNGEDKPSLLNLAVGCNGVLYPPKALAKEAFEIDKIRKWSLHTDDLWLKCMSVLNNVKVINCNTTILIYFNILKAQKFGLWQTNTKDENRNDKVWRVLMREYPQVKEKILMEECQKLK